MAVRIILKNSSVEDKRPSASQLENGEIALNYNEAGAFLTCKDTNGDIQQVGGVKINEVAPDAPPIQCLWFQPSSLTLFVYDGDSWLPVAGGGGGGTPPVGGAVITVIGNDGIDADTTTLPDGTKTVTLDVELDGTNCGLKFNNSKLSAEIASDSKLGSVKIGDGIDVAIDGTISVTIPQTLTFRGSVDLNNPPSGQINPDPAVAGDAYAVTLNALSVATGWTGIVGDTANAGDLAVFDGTNWELIATGGTMQAVEGGDGIQASTAAGIATVAVDLADTDAGLEFDSTDTDNVKLKASIASDTQLGSVKIGDGIDVTADGVISVPASVSEVDLDYIESATQGEIDNSAGDNAIIPLASVGDDSDPLNIIPPVAGLFTGEEKAKLAGIEDGATNQDTNDGRYVKIVGDATVQTITGTGGLKTEGLLESSGGVKVSGGSADRFAYFTDQTDNNFFAGSTYIGGTTARNTFDLWKSTLTEEQLEQLKAGTLAAPANVATPGDGEFARQWYYNQQDAETQALLDSGELEYPTHLAAATFTDTFALGDNTNIKLINSGVANFSCNGSGFINLSRNSSISPRLIIKRDGAGTITENAFMVQVGDFENVFAIDYAGGVTIASSLRIKKGSNGGSTRSDYRGIYLDDIKTNTAGDVVYGIYSPITSSGTGENYNFYAAGTAPNFFAGDVEVGTGNATGVVLTSPSGNKFRLTVDDAGNLSTVAV